MPFWTTRCLIFNKYIALRICGGKIDCPYTDQHIQELYELLSIIELNINKAIDPIDAIAQYA